MRGMENKKDVGARGSKEQAHYLAQISSHQKREDLGNTRCAECDDLGTTYICMTFGVFVCASCAGLQWVTMNRANAISFTCGPRLAYLYKDVSWCFDAHSRELSHRVKGIAMSFWTPEEVDFILAHTNAKVNAHFLRGYGATDRPRPKSGDVQNLRQWLKEKYSEERWANKGATRRSDTVSRRASAARGSRRSDTTEPTTGAVSADCRSSRQVAASQSSQLLTGDDDEFLGIFQATKAPATESRQATPLVHSHLSPERQTWLKTDQNFSLSGDDDNAFDCNPFKPHVTNTGTPATQNVGPHAAADSLWADRVQSQGLSFTPEVSYFSSAGGTPHCGTQSFPVGVGLHTVGTPQVASLTTQPGVHAFRAFVPESDAEHRKGTLGHSCLTANSASLTNTATNPLSTGIVGTSGVWNPPSQDRLNGPITPAVQLTRSNQEMLFPQSFNHQTVTDPSRGAAVLSTTMIPPKKDGVKDKDAFEGLGVFGWPGPPSSLHSR